MRYVIKLSYDGTALCGWQSQPNAQTVQDILEDALSKILRADVSVTGAGRTDAGVNAIGYIAHFDVSETLDTEKIGCKLNAILPSAIVILSIIPTADDFHARFLASRREYTYFLNRNKDPFVSDYSWFCSYVLDFESMDRAASLLVGKHDFSCFEKTGSDARTSICTVIEAGWHRYEPAHSALMGFPGEYWYFRISADRFLRNMVRAIVGTLIDVGRGKRSLEDFASLILPAEDNLSGHNPKRSAAGESVPGHALFLSGVDYPGGSF